MQLSIYNLLGRKVAEIVNTVQSSGEYMVTWSGRDADGVELATGLYLYRLETSKGSLTRRMMFIR